MQLYLLGKRLSSGSSGRASRFPLLWPHPIKSTLAEHCSSGALQWSQAHACCDSSLGIRLECALWWWTMRKSLNKSIAAISVLCCLQRKPKMTSTVTGVSTLCVHLCMWIYLDKMHQGIVDNIYCIHGLLILEPYFSFTYLKSTFSVLSTDVMVVIICLCTKLFNPLLKV